MSIPAKKIITTDPAQKWPAFVTMDAAIAVSGTVGLELSVANVPHIIGYKMNGLTWRMIEKKLTTKYAHLTNILLDKAAVPEFIQKDCKADSMKPALEELLDGGKAAGAQKKILRKYVKPCCPKGATVLRKKPRVLSPSSIICACPEEQIHGKQDRYKPDADGQYARTAPRSSLSTVIPSPQSGQQQTGQGTSLSGTPWPSG